MTFFCDTLKNVH